MGGMTFFKKEILREMARTLYDMELTDEELALVQAQLEELRKDLEAMEAFADQWAQFEPAEKYPLTK
jgi:hypothetical protein